MTSRDYTSTQRSAFGELVREGVYDARFSHPAQAREFFDRVLSGIMTNRSAGSGVSVLDCGCGPGAWLGEVLSLTETGGPAATRVYGFDLTPEMVHVCRDRFAGRVPPDHFREGDILTGESYEFPDGTDRFDVIFAYDVIQQLPRKLQYRACQMMLTHLTSSGVAVVFDHDSRSGFGRKMGFKKFVTQYLGLPLVPRYYCNAKYPPLGRFAARFAKTEEHEAELRFADSGYKAALIIGSKPEPETCS